MSTVWPGFGRATGRNLSISVSSGRQLPGYDRAGTRSDGLGFVKNKANKEMVYILWSFSDSYSDMFIGSIFFKSDNENYNTCIAAERIPAGARADIGHSTGKIVTDADSHQCLVYSRISGCYMAIPIYLGCEISVIYDRFTA
jgi:hypothetical protein